MNFRHGPSHICLGDNKKRRFAYVCCSSSFTTIHCKPRRGRFQAFAGILGIFGAGVAESFGGLAE